MDERRRRHTAVSSVFGPLGNSPCAAGADVVLDAEDDASNWFQLGGAGAAAIRPS